MLRPLLALVVCLAATPAAAHPAPFSYLDIVVRDGGIEGTLVVHVIDVAHDLGIEPVERLLDNAVVARERQRIGELLQPRVTVPAGASEVTIAPGGAVTGRAR